MIDAHQHVWSLGKHGCAWPTAADGPIFRDYSLDDFERVAVPLGIDWTVLVQSQENELDTAWLLDLASHEERVAGVVGWTELGSARAPARIAALAMHPKLVGLRPMVQDREPGWYDLPPLQPGFAAMVEQGLALDALVRVNHLAALKRLARAFPDLRIVINHAAKPAIDSARGFDAWRRAMAPLADRPNVSCKLSGLLTERGSAPAEAIAPYVEAILGLFGADRVMWGSDWPVIELDSPYAGWLAIGKALVPRAMHSCVFSGTAARFYGLELKVAA